MPRTRGVVPRRLRREIGLCGGAAVDRFAELLFRVRHRPEGLLHVDVDATAHCLDAAIAAGARFLQRRQHGDGSWRGFLLYPGASTTWLTAHVAFVLEEMPHLEGLCARAADFLHSVGANDGGWGYNRRVAVDCDSWSQGLMVLLRFALPCEDFLVSNLASAQLSCGAFPTYPPDSDERGTVPNGWQSAHPEVSAMVAEALRRSGGFDDSVERCLCWLRDVSPGGVLRSYWWSDDCYALWVQARTHLLAPAAWGRVSSALQSNAGIPQLAMVLTAAAELGFPDDVFREGVRRILLEQLSDGSWPCAPCLRVTSPTHTGLGPDPPGAVVADRRRVFSTAHAIAALDRVDKRLFPAGATTLRCLTSAYRS